MTDDDHTLSADQLAPYGHAAYVKESEAMARRPLRSAGEIAYNAYGASRAWVTISGAPMPPWAEQAPDIAKAWEAAARAVMSEVEVVIKAPVAIAADFELTAVDRARIDAALIRPGVPVEIPRAYAAELLARNQNQHVLIANLRNELKDVQEQVAAQKGATTRATEQRDDARGMVQALAQVITEADPQPILAAGKDGLALRDVLARGAQIIGEWAELRDANRGRDAEAEQ